MSVRACVCMCLSLIPSTNNYVYLFYKPIYRYLAEQMSSDEMTSANQDPNLKGSFKFGRGQFFPMILLLVRNGRRVEEYTGVINEVNGL